MIQKLRGIRKEYYMKKQFDEEIRNIVESNGD